MYAKYIKRELPDLNGTGQTQACYQMQLRPMNFKTFVAQCAREHGVQESLIESALTVVRDELSLCMAEGFSVKLEGIGIFHAKLGPRDDKLQDAFEPGETTRNAHTIKVDGVSFKAAPELIRNTDRKCVLERGSVSRLRKSKLTLEERIQKAHAFLKEYPIMRVPDYARATGLSRTTASLELRKLEHDPSSGITSIGARSQKYYILRKERIKK